VLLPCRPAPPAVVALPVRPALAADRLMVNQSNRKENGGGVAGMPLQPRIESQEIEPTKVAKLQSGC